MVKFCTGKALILGLIASAFFIQKTDAENIFSQNLNYRIIIPDAPTKVQSFAASELDGFLKKSYSTPVEINGAISSVDFFIGISDAAKKNGFTVNGTDKDFGILRNGNAFLFKGFDDKDIDPEKSPAGSSGTLLAVYYFLGKYAGTEFYFPGEKGYTVSLNKKIVFPDTSDIPRPSFESRGFSFEFKEYTPKEINIFSRRLLNNLPNKNNTDINILFCQWAKRFAKTHPEYFIVKDGKKILDGPPYCFPCPSNPGAIKQIVTEIEHGLKKDPTAQNIRVFCRFVPRKMHCECESCKKKNIDSWFYEFLQDIANKAHKSNPELRFLAIADEKSQAEALTTLDDSFTILLLRNAYNNNPMPLQLLEKLKAAKKKILIEEMVPHEQGDYPVIRPDYTASSIKNTCGLADGIKYCMQWGKINPCPYSFCAFELVLSSRLLFNANVDSEKITEKFFSFAYPGAEKEMREFYSEMEKTYMPYDKNPQKNGPFTCVYKLENLTKPIALLEAAKQKISGKSTAFEQLYNDFKHFYAKSLEFDKMLKNSVSQINVPYLEKIPQGSPENWTGALKMDFLTPFTYENFQKSSAYLFNDGKNLYIGLAADENQISQLVGNQHSAGSIWKDDSFEIMLVPPESALYYQIIANSKGIYRILSHQLSDNSDTLKETSVSIKNMELSATILKDRWTLSIKIPLSELNPSSSDREWLFDVFRNRYCGEKWQQSGLRLLSFSFHNVDAYIKMRIVNRQP